MEPIITSYDPADHYWKREDGQFYSSRAGAYVGDDDTALLLWRQRGGVETRFPKDTDGSESEEILRAILRQQGIELFASESVARRRAAYVEESDAFRNEALSYQTEAQAWLLEGNEEKAAAAKAKAETALHAYLEAKQTIRDRIPDEAFRVNSSGSTYHRLTCSYATGAGIDMTLGGIALKHPTAKPCSRCNPPALA